jgi:hypothetical protein
MLLRSSNTVVFCAIHDLIPLPGKPLPGLPEFLDSLAAAGIPCVWITSQNRHQLDGTLRKFGHGEPFIAEGGSCVYLAEDYFHLKPAHTVRLGRFIAIPAAKPQPAAAEALDLLSGQSGVAVVPLRSLSPRELAQNTGLARNDAEAIRQRDFDELFFFAGASDKDIRRFLDHASHAKVSVRPYGALWSLAINPSLASCVRELRRLYERTFHRAAFFVGLATATDCAELFPCCDRAVLLTDRSGTPSPAKRKAGHAPKSLSLLQQGTWDEALEAIRSRQF